MNHPSIRSESSDVTSNSHHNGDSNTSTDDDSLSDLSSEFTSSLATRARRNLAESKLECVRQERIAERRKFQYTFRIGTYIENHCATGVSLRRYADYISKNINLQALGSTSKAAVEKLQRSVAIRYMQQYGHEMDQLYYFTRIAWCMLEDNKNSILYDDNYWEEDNVAANEDIEMEPGQGGNLDLMSVDTDELYDNLVEYTERVLQNPKMVQVLMSFVLSQKDTKYYQTHPYSEIGEAEWSPTLLIIATMLVKAAQKSDLISREVIDKKNNRSVTKPREILLSERAIKFIKGALGNPHSLLSKFIIEPAMWDEPDALDGFEEVFIAKDDKLARVCGAAGTVQHQYQFGQAMLLVKTHLMISSPIMPVSVARAHAWDYNTLGGAIKDLNACTDHMVTCNWYHEAVNQVKRLNKEAQSQARRKQKKPQKQPKQRLATVEDCLNYKKTQAHMISSYTIADENVKGCQLMNCIIHFDYGKKVFVKSAALATFSQFQIDRSFKGLSLKGKGTKAQEIQAIINKKLVYNERLVHNAEHRFDKGEMKAAFEKHLLDTLSVLIL